MEAERSTPVVFISYSHDSKEHKQWVLTLAQRLRDPGGVDVIIDQWDLEPGDDVPKFMEYWVQKAGRVLMICTEAYVQKVNEGRGGAGYEAMIVTQQLIQDLGGNRFIPIVRQANPPLVLPTCVATRKAVNLSEYANADEEFYDLIERLHRIAPNSKPPLGAGPAKRSAPPHPAVLSIADVSLADPIATYDHALNVAQSRDLIAWRRLVDAQKAAVNGPLVVWRDKHLESSAKKVSELPTLVTEGLRSYQHLFATALAGIESCENKVNQQGSLIYDLIKPSDWERSGWVVVLRFPDAAAWAFQALAGAMYVRSGQISLALDLLTQRINLRNRGSSPLFKISNLTGWPESLGSQCWVSWEYLQKMPENFSWLEKAFSSAEVFSECLCGYYFLMNWVEYISVIEEDKTAAMETPEGLRLEAPPFFLNCNDHPAGLRRILQERSALVGYETNKGVTSVTSKLHWNNWIRQTLMSASTVFGLHWDSQMQLDELSHFAEDLHL